MQPNIAAAVRRAQQAEQGARGPPTPVVGARGGRAPTAGAPSVSTAPIRAPRGQTGALPRLAPRPPGVGQVPLTARPPATFGPRFGPGAAAPGVPQLTPEEEATLFADIEATIGEFNIPPESYEEVQRYEREARLATATPGPINAQQMIEFFRNAGQDPNAPPDVQVQYPDGELGPARYSICAEAINERWGGFTRRLFERMEQERRRGPGTVAGRLGEGLRSLALTTQYEQEHYTLGVNIAGAPPAISNAVLLPVGPPQATVAVPFVALTPPAARGLERAAIQASGNVMDALGAVADQIRTEGGISMTIDELEREMLSPEPSNDPLIREGQQRVDEIIATEARAVAAPLANAIEQQTQMESMMGQFPAGVAPTAAAAVAQQPPLVTPITPQQADALVTANVEAQQQEAASRRATPVPSPVAAGSVPAAPLGAGAPSPAQVTAALQRAVAQGTAARPQERRRARQPAQPVGRPGRPGARTAPTTPQGAAPAAPVGYPSAPTTPLYALTNVIRTTGEAPDTQALGVASPPVVPATTDGVLQLVEADIRRILNERTARRRGALASTTATLTGIRQQLQSEAQQAPELAQVTRTSIANLLAAEQVPPEVAQEVTAYLEQPGEVNPNAVRDVAERLLQVQSEAAAAAPTRTKTPGQRAAASARERLAKNITDAADTVDEYNQQIAQDIQDPLFEEVRRILGEADAADVPVSDELVNIFYDRAYGLAVVAVNGVSGALNEIAAREARAPGGRGAVTVTPGAQ